MTIIIDGKTARTLPPWGELELDAPPDLADVTSPWGIFYVSSGHYLGRLVHTAPNGVMTLAPAYAYVAQTNIVKGQGISRPKFILPLEQLVSATTIELPPCPVVWINTWDETDRADVIEGIKSAEDMRKKLAAARAGITIAPAGTKLPPLRRV